MAKLKIRKDDEVIVVSGRDRGKRGKVLRALPTENRVVVEGVNVVKRHTKPSQADPQGGIKEKEAPIHVSNVALIDPKSDGPTRVGFKLLTDGRKVRVAKRSGEVIDV
jgi:large subunit ribosomal protein L24